ncbi:hypothetical protein D3C75_1384890 [compost metagenome]
MAARLAMRRVSIAEAKPMVVKLGISRKPKVLTPAGRVWPWISSTGGAARFATAIGFFLHCIDCRFWI